MTKGLLVKITIALATIGLGAWIKSNVEFDTRKVSVPLSGEALSNPFYAAERFSEALGADAAWEHVFTAPRADAVLMLSTWNWSLSRSRRASIERWVEAGGRLVVDRSLIGGREDFAKWSGIEQIEHDAERAPHDDASGSDGENEDLLPGFFPKQCDTLIEGGTSRPLRVCGIDKSYSLTATRPMIWELRDGRRIHALRVAVGRGSVTVLNVVPFKRRDLFLGDHATLFVRATQLVRGDEIAILTEQQQPSLLALVWRFGAPAVLLALAALAFGLWRAAVRFGPAIAATDPARRSLAEQIRGTGRFALRFGGGRALHAATARALRDAAIIKLPAYDQMSGSERAAALAGLTGVGADELSPALNYTGARGAHELRQSIAILESARRLLTGRSTHGN
jgi:hypothetical protein